METNATFVLHSVTRIVDTYYPKLGMQFDKKKRQYGCLQLWGVEPHPLKLTQPFGVVPAESGCYEIVQEKVGRLASYAHAGHLSSHQSRNPNHSKYAGAIRLPESSPFIRYMAWSSFPEPVDEAFMCGTAIRAGLMDRGYAYKIADLSANREMLPVLNFMNV